MKIAGDLTIEKWKELEKKLKPSYNSHWKEAYEFFESRICTRYLKPIGAILNMKSYKGEGFAVVNLQCSLIETIESFINGWIYFYPNFVNPQGIILKGNDKIFKSFFNKREPFKNYSSKINGKRFYVDVRCGLLHEAQTKNNWKIKKGKSNNLSYEVKDGFHVLHRDNFQKDFEELIKKYKDAIINGKDFDEVDACVLRTNFVSKFNHICKQS